ncbi:hypothetical protein, partial [Lysinibacillus agricola]|uniref:hypothetical protein n=1 Tax=Lysinibacillus agricola TaxID=2590012 RepID=UPI003C1CF3CF
NEENLHSLQTGFVTKSQSTISQKEFFTKINRFFLKTQKTKHTKKLLLALLLIHMKATYSGSCKERILSRFHYYLMDW